MISGTYVPTTMDNLIDAMQHRFVPYSNVYKGCKNVAEYLMTDEGFDLLQKTRIDQKVREAK